MARRDATNSHKGPKGAKSGKGRKGSGFTISGILDMAASGKESLDAMDAEVRIRVHVGAGCDRGLVLAAKEALRAERAGGVVEVMAMEAPAAGLPDPDAAVVLGGAREPGAAALIRLYLACEIPCAYVASSALDAPDVSSHSDAGSLFEALGVSEPAVLGPRLGSWLAGAVDNPIALAANFAFCRPAVCSRLTAACAAENAAVGAIAFIPGSDFPIMCASQVKLALDIAAAHGSGIEPARALEVAGVVGAGLAYRGVARGVAGLVPGFGWLLKAGMGYAGTLATGRAVQARFEGVALAFPVAGGGDCAGAGDASAALPAPAADAGRGSSARKPIFARARRGRAESAPAPAASASSDNDGYLDLGQVGGRAAAKDAPWGEGEAEGGAHES